MKVLQVLPELNSGGVERGTLELAEYLSEHGHQSVVLSGGGRIVPKLEAAGSKHIALPVGRKSLKSLLLIPKLRQLLQDEQPDILHLRSRVPAWLMWHVWKRLPKEDRPSLVSTVHGFYSVNKWSKIMCCGERVICVSDSIKEYVIKHYPDTDPAKLRVVPRGVDPSVYPYGYRPDEEWLKAFISEFPELDGKKLITLPGRITRLKGHDDLLTIIRSLKDRPDIHALVVGGAHPKKTAYRDEILQKVEASGLKGRITFTGNRDDLRNILAISTLVLSLTTQPESFGRTTLEALAMGIPVAGYAHGGVAEQLDYLCPEGRIKAMDVNDAIRVIKQMLDDQVTVKNENPFTLQKMLEGTLSVYQELTTKRH